MRKKRKGLFLAVLAVLALAAGAWLYLSGQTESASYISYEVTQGSLTTYYNFDGLVHAPRVQTITAPQAGTVRTVYVEQNQQVREGDRLYRLDSGETVEADLTGEVTGLFIEAGDVVTSGETVVEIIDMERLEIELDVDEYDVRAVAPGAAVQATVLATESTFDTVVSALNKNGTASGDLSYYTATAPMGRIEGVYPGMQVSAKVLREHVQDAALLRMDALQFDEYNEPFVLVSSGKGEPQRVAVTLGVSDGVYCQIVSGVQAGDTVLKERGMSMMELMLELDAKTR